MTMWLATKADINVGVITCIWSINPLFIAILDYFIFSYRLRYYHVIGMVSLILCGLSISLTKEFDPIFNS